MRKVLFTCSWMVLVAALSACGGGGLGAGVPPADGAGGGGGSDPGPSDPAGLDLDPPGTFEDRSDYVLRHETHTLQASEGVWADPASGLVTLATPKQTYWPGDVLIGDAAHPFLKRVTRTQTTSGGGLLLETEPATLADAIDYGRLRFRFTPDWAGGTLNTGTYGGPSKTNPPDLPYGLYFSPSGKLSITDFVLCKLVVLDGKVRWESSIVMGKAGPKASEGNSALDEMETNGGEFIVRVRKGAVTVVPTIDNDHDFDWSRGGLQYAWAKMDLDFRFDLEVEVEASAAIDLDLTQHLFPPIRIDVPVGAIWVTAEFEMPVNVALEAGLAGTADFEFHHEHTVSTTVGWRKGTGFYAHDNDVPSPNPTYDLDLDLRGNLWAKVSLDPRIGIKLCSVIGPYLHIQPYIEADVDWPIESNVKDLFVGIDASAGLELTDPIFGATIIDAKVGPYEIYRKGWDIVKPGLFNQAPQVQNMSLSVDAKGRTFALPASDPDGDTLTYTFLEWPSNGTLSPVPSVRGQVTYVPKSGYSGSDRIRFYVSDGIDMSGVGVISITVTGSGTTPPQTANLQVKVKDASGNALSGATVTMKKSGSSATVGQKTTLSSGAVTFSKLAAGTYTATVTRTGYQTGSTTATITSANAGSTISRSVTLKKTGAKTTKLELSVNPLTLLPGNSLTAKATLKDDQGNRVYNRTVNLTFPKATRSSSTGTSGTATVSYTPQVTGSFYVKASFAGDSTYKASSKQVAVTVTPPAKTTLTLKLSKSNVKVGESVTATATLTANGTAVTSKQIKITFPTKQYTTTSGKAVHTAAKAGTHTITASFAGDNKYQSSKGTATLTIVSLTSTQMSLSLPSYITMGYSGKITATLKTSSGQGIKGKTVEVKIGGVRKALQTTDASGSISFNHVPRSAGTHSVVASFAGDSTHKASSTTKSLSVVKGGTKMTVSVSPTSAIVGGTVTAVATLKTASGYALGSKQIYLTFPNVQGTTLTNSNGAGTIVYTTKPTGTITVTASWPGDANYTSSKASTSFKVKSKTATKLTLSVPSSMAMGNSWKITAKLEESALPYYDIKGKTVRILVDGSQRSMGTTNANGEISFWYIPKSAKSHTFKATFAEDATHKGCSTSTARTVAKGSTKMTLTISPTTVALGGKVTATMKLMDAYGRALASRQVKVTFPKAQGTTNTNSSGIGVIAHTTQTSGTVKATASFAGDASYKASSTTASIKVTTPKSSKMKVTLSTSSAKKNDYVKITAKLEESAFPWYDIKGKKIKILINGSQIYTWTSDANGEISCYYQPKSTGSFTVSASFAGDTAYYSCSASKTLTVK